MSTASPLPLQPLPDAVVSTEEQLRRRQEVAARLEQHRRRRPPAGSAQQILPQIELPAPPAARTRPGRRVADSVAARFSQSPSYRDFLAQEAEAAIRQAEAAAEVARRNAEAIAAAQQHLLHDIEQWNRAAADGVPAELVMQSTTPALLAEVLPFAEPSSTFAGHTEEVATHTPVHAATVTVRTPATLPAQPDSTFAQAMTEALTAQATTTGGLLFETTTADAAFAEPLEPPTGLPTNLIEFPRQLVAARKARPRLAEGPLREEADRSPDRAQLRIFEVEPEAFSTVPLPALGSALPEWSSIRLDSWQAPHETAAPDAQVSLSMPLYTAAVSTRCMAAAVDICCLLAVFLAAVAAAGYASPVLPTGLPAMAAAAGSLLLLGVLYLVFFFTFTDATPGMRYARIALCTFNDDNPTRSAMRRRLFATALSVVPLGLGLVWAWLDDDRLGWHDRISRMYQREY